MDVKAVFLLTTFLSFAGGVISFIFSKFQLPLLGGLKGALSSAMTDGGLGGFDKNKKLAPEAKPTPKKRGPMRSPPQPKGRSGGGNKLRGGRGGKKWGRGLLKKTLQKLF